MNEYFVPTVLITNNDKNIYCMDKTFWTCSTFMKRSCLASFDALGVLWHESNFFQSYSILKILKAFRKKSSFFYFYWELSMRKRKITVNINPKGNLWIYGLHIYSKSMPNYMPRLIIRITEKLS